jgi:hypothetical protein
MQIRFFERKKDDPSSAMPGGRQSATGNWQPQQKDGSNVAPAAGENRRTGGLADGRTDLATGLDEDCRRLSSGLQLTRCLLPFVDFPYFLIGWATYLLLTRFYFLLPHFIYFKTKIK